MIDEAKARSILKDALAVSNDILKLYRSISEHEEESRLAAASIIYNVQDKIVLGIANEFPSLKEELESGMGKLFD